MNSKKCIWGFRVGPKTYRNFTVPREVINSEFTTRKQVKVMKKINNRRARKLDYVKLLGY